MEQEPLILHLPLEAKYYLMIESGEKPEEYRRIKPYWCQRIQLCPCPKGYDYASIDPGHHLGTRHCSLDSLPCPVTLDTYSRKYTHALFRYGYTKRTMLFEIRDITIGYGNPEWGAPEDEEVYIIKLGKKIEQTC